MYFEKMSLYTEIIFKKKKKKSSIFQAYLFRIHFDVLIMLWLIGD